MRKLLVGPLALLMNPILAETASDNDPAVRISLNLMILGGLSLLILFSPFIYRALNRPSGERDEDSGEQTRE